MDLDDYYAEQEKRMNLPHETLEEYYQRVAVLKQQSMEKHVDSFSAVNTAAQLPSQEISGASNAAPELSQVSRSKVTHKMSENEIESASKRQKLCDQEKVGDYPPLMQLDQIPGTRSRHSSPIVLSEFQSSIPDLQMNEDDSIDSLILQAVSVSRCEEKRKPHLPSADISDDIQASTELKSRGLPSNDQGSAALVTRHVPLPHSADGVQDDINSFTEDSIMPPRSKLDQDISGAAPENSPICSFSVRLESRNKRIQEVIPSRRQQRLELRPVDDAAQLLGKKLEHAPDPPTSPIEDGSTTRIAKHAIKQNDKPLKRTVHHTVIVDQPAGNVAPAVEGSMIFTTSSPQLQPDSVVATTSKKVDKDTKKTTTEKQKSKGKKVKPQLVTPAEYARMLQEKAAVASAGNNDEERSLKKRKSPLVRFLTGKNIFYTGGDMKYATETTRGRMNIIVKFGGNLMPEFDPQVTTHVITDANVLPTLRALGMRGLKDIPDHIPTVRWSWILSVLGKESLLSKDEIERKLGDTWLHAAFSKRMDAGYQPQKTASLTSWRDKSRLKMVDETHASPSSIKAPPIASMEQHVEQDATPAAALGGFINISGASSTFLPAETSTGEDDPFRNYLEAQLKDDGWSSLSNREDSDDGEEIHIQPMKPTKRGWTCDSKEPKMAGGCPNQDIIDKLEELMQLHKAKVGDEDHWRAFTYNKCIRALRSYPKRIESSEEARKIRGIGEKTARKIEEILQTGELRRIKYENTEDVAVTRLFQGIYGVGQSTALQWWAAGCRTLEDLRKGKGGVKLSSVQEIGLLHYDDINDRMPRDEAKAIFECIKKIALEIDSNLFVEIMGSYRRGKATCGDIDILITRPTDDGKTHSGVLPRLLKDLHTAKILTEDLAMPDDPEDLEAIYRGLCVRPGTADARRRRIDFLCVPWKSRGGALIYYTGDDIFNRAMRLKANVMGYSLNQRGLFGNVIRDPRDRRVKLNDGVLIASETEEEIFKILNVPWQEPHERVRG